MNRYGFIVNARAGRHSQVGVVRAAAEKLRGHGHEVREYDCPDDPSEPVARAIRDDCTVIVACGGDGTVGGVANALNGSHRVLAVLPLGTLNHFARDLGIHGVEAAERVLLEGRVLSIDAGAVNGQLFVNNSGIGIYPSIVLEREVVRKRGIPKWPAFIHACLKALVNLPFLRLHLEADGRHLARITPFLFVGNNVYETEGFSVGTRKRLDAGELGVCTARHHGPLGLLRIAFRALTGHVRQDRDFTLLIVRRLTVRAKGKATLNVSLDGELRRMTLPLEYSTAPGALRVLAP